MEDGHSIEATGEHPFFVEGKGFIAAKRLARSDLLVDQHGRYHAVVSVTERRGNFIVYNVEVANTHTYYAGAGGSTISAAALQTHGRSRVTSGIMAVILVRRRRSFMSARLLTSWQIWIPTPL